MTSDEISIILEYAKAISTKASDNYALIKTDKDIAFVRGKIENENIFQEKGVPWGGRVALETDIFSGRGYIVNASFEEGAEGFVNVSRPEILSSTKAKLNKIMEMNRFTDTGLYPIIYCFRNIHFPQLLGNDVSYKYIEDTGDNICDTVIIQSGETYYYLAARSYPHDDYLKKSIKQGGKGSNYIATGFYEKALRRGIHLPSKPDRSYDAFIQNIKFVLWRSLNMVLKDEDDYCEHAIVGDNLHANAPYSAGCITVEGKAKPYPTGAFKVLKEWGYELHHNKSFFSVVLLNYSDWDKPKYTLRIGSYGSDVKELQEILGITQDGDFGPVTHFNVIEYQKRKSLFADGIVGKLTQKSLKSA